MSQIMIVADDTVAVHRIRIVLECEGHKAYLAKTKQETSNIMNNKHIDLILLDVAMPMQDGYAFAEDLRLCDESIPMLMMTAKHLPEEQCGIFVAGKDDYILKPINEAELLLRVKALLRRSLQTAETLEEHPPIIQYGSLKIYPSQYNVYVDSKKIPCTPKEVKLLSLLASHPGRVYDRGQILSLLWDYHFYGDTRTVDTHIKRLRQKIVCEEMGKVWDIVTVYGVGYKFDLYKEYAGGALCSAF